MEDAVQPAVDLERIADVLLDESELRIVQQEGDVGAAAGDEIVDGDDVMPIGDPAIRQMGGYKAGSA